MKKITLMLACFLAFGIASAQKPNVINAYNSLRNDNLAKAKGYIDLASEHEDTKNDAKTWFYKGNIYFAIAISKTEKIKALDSNALTKAQEYYEKANNLDATVSNEMLGIQTPDIGLAYIAEMWAKKGDDCWKNRDYYNAYLNYSKASQCNKKENQYKYYIALSGNRYEQTKSKNDSISLAKEVKRTFEELITAKFKNEKMYEYLSTIYMDEKDTVKALRVANNAGLNFPDSINSLLVKCKVYFWANKGADVAQTLEKVKSKGPNNPVVFTSIGSMLELINFEESEKAYIKAKELVPDNFLVNFNLAALYFNKFADLKKAASKIKDDDEYNKQMEEANKYLAMARPVAEKCNALPNLDNRDKKDIVFMLKQIYANSKELVKAQEMDALLKTLK
jgi:tetratricopeptide (TPR) repeat protein